MDLQYKDINNGQRYTGIAIHPENRFICVTKRDGTWHIYNVIDGKPFIPIQFEHKEDAIDVAKFLHERYGEYLDMLEMKDWKGVDIPFLFQYTVPNGVEICKRFEQFKYQVMYEAEPILNGLT